MLLVLPAASPVTCHHLKCAPGAVGCLHYEANEPSTSEEYMDVKPVELAWDEEEEELAEVSVVRAKKLNDVVNDLSDLGDGFQCVFQHLNDENFRHILLYSVTARV